MGDPSHGRHLPGEIAAVQVITKRAGEAPVPATQGVVETKTKNQLINFDKRRVRGDSDGEENLKTKLKQSQK